MATQRMNLRARRPAAARGDAGYVAAADSVALTHRDVATKLAALGCDPLAIMAELAMDRTLDPKLRAAMAKDLAAYQLVVTQSAADESMALPPLGEVIAAAWRKPTYQKSVPRKGGSK